MNKPSWKDISPGDLVEVSSDELIFFRVSFAPDNMLQFREARIQTGDRILFFSSPPWFPMFVVMKVVEYASSLLVTLMHPTQGLLGQSFTKKEFEQTFTVVGLKR